MNIPLADYHNERKAFDALFHPSCDRRILMFRGESGSGKTSLLEDCRARARKETQIPCINIDLKGSAVTVAEIFSRSSSKLGGDRLVNFKRQMAELRGIPEVNISSNTQTGFGNEINVTLHVTDPTDREQRRAALTEALFADLKLFQQPVLFVMDTFEQATTEVTDWISGPFLARVEQVTQVRALVAGQKVPNAQNIEWGYCCTTHELFGVREAEHWMPVVQAMRRRIPVDPPLTWLAGVCHAYQGRPSEIMKVIEALPLEGRV